MFAVIRVAGGHWIMFDDAEVKPGSFADADAARWGGWARPSDILNINAQQGRLITMEDIQAIIKERFGVEETADV